GPAVPSCGRLQWRAGCSEACVRLVLLGLCAGIAAAQISVDAVGRYWIPEMSTRIRVEAGGFGTDIDPRGDLGPADTGFPEAVVTVRAGRHRFTFSYTPIEYSSDQDVNRTVFFRGRQYTIGTRVVSDLDVKQLELTWSWQFVRAANGRFRLGPM